jgi:hypothetical protein
VSVVEKVDPPECSQSDANEPVDGLETPKITARKARNEFFNRIDRIQPFVGPQLSSAVHTHTAIHDRKYCVSVQSSLLVPPLFLKALPVLGFPDLPCQERGSRIRLT